MKLYHYSVDSYKGAEHLTNDYKNNYRFAEPYILALRQSRETFNTVFFATMYMSREVKALGLRNAGVEVVSCPTCGRTNIDLIGLANDVEKMVAEFDHLNIKVAVMGCVVNGPGEAREADIGIAGGVGEGLLIRKGEVVRKVPEEELLDTLRDALLHWEQ